MLCRPSAKPQQREEKHWVSEWCLKGFSGTTEEVPRKPYSSTEEYFSIGISHPCEGEREVKLSFLIRCKEISDKTALRSVIQRRCVLKQFAIHLVLILLIGV